MYKKIREQRSSRMKEYMASKKAELWSSFFHARRESISN